MLTTYAERSTAIFSRETWIATDCRTTPRVRGYNSALNAQYKHHCPETYRFNAILEEHNKQLERRIAKLQVGVLPKKRKCKYVLVDKVIACLKDQ